MKKPTAKKDQGKLIAILYIDKVVENTVKTEPCVFCGTQHSHGLPEGHRVSHCTQSIATNVKEGRVHNEDGYFIKLK